jgi:LysM repeat protein
MPRTYHWKWVGLIAVILTPGLALAQAAAPQTHTVRQGDTLWDLAKQYRGDPFLWPDLYRINTNVVEDPHWIYPGEVLQLVAGDSVHAVPTADTPAPPTEAVAAASTDTVATDSVAVDSAAVATSEPQAPEPEPVAEPASLAQLTQVSAGESGDEQGLFGPKRTKMLQESLRAYTHQTYRPLRRSEFYSSGFLTENEKLPFGKVLGPVIPEQISASSTGKDALPYSLVGVEAPRGASYQVGDTLLVARIGPEFRGFGEVVIPTGLLRVMDTVQGNYVASVIATYGPIRNGQRVLPAEKFTPSGEVHAVPVSEGVHATFLGGPGRQDMKTPQMVVFLDKGREDGVAPGDMFEIRRTAERLPDGRQLINDVMATMQVVHVRDHTATARLLNILSPDIAPGTGAWQVAKLPS